MEMTECTVRQSASADEFSQHESRQDGRQVTSSLCYGFTTLRNMFFTRVHDDVERNFGVDSMLLSAAYLRSEKKTKVEIELFQIAEATTEAGRRGYVTDQDWFAHWLMHLRLGDAHSDARVQKRLADYRSLEADQRRLNFLRVLERTFKEATRAPLVLFQLFPLSVGIVTSVAFGEALDAGELRNRQLFWLPGIADCHECHGRLLDNGEKCKGCGNPVWDYQWLNAPD